MIIPGNRKGDSFCNRDTETSAGGQTQADSVDCA